MCVCVFVSRLYLCTDCNYVGSFSKLLSGIFQLIFATAITKVHMHLFTLPKADEFSVINCRKNVCVIHLSRILFSLHIGIKFSDFVQEKLFLTALDKWTEIIYIHCSINRCLFLLVQNSNTILKAVFGLTDFFSYVSYENSF